MEFGIMLPTRADSWRVVQRAEALGALGWTLHRHLKAGAVHAHVLRPLAAISQATAAMAIAGHPPTSPTLANPAGAQP